MTVLANKVWRVLLVEDDPDDHFIAQSLFAELQHRRVSLDWAHSCEEARERLVRDSYDAVLVDHHLTDGDGIDLIADLNAAGQAAPLILMTGLGSYELDMRAMQAGAADYLAKHDLTAPLLERTIRYAIDRKVAERSLMAVNHQLEQAKDRLEQRVRERTSQLIEKNLALEEEIQRRLMAESELAEVQRRLLDRAENERLELAQDLHDGPMQELYALTFRQLALAADLDGTPAGAEIADQQEQLQRVIKSLRSLASQLRPPALAPFGLEKAIRSHAEEFQSGHPELALNLSLSPDEQILEERVRMALFRIYQVALTNVIRHAQARRVDITLALDPESLVLEVRDDGRGFDVPASWYELAHRGHLGLAGAAERAAAAGGILQVDSAPGRGTCMRVIVPLAERIAEKP